mmetsp:Transcript_41593/g.114638  ORF Transcript_41593/g.114638 Transcript_41593/m.114638 type:complete len:242 (+) Transcript_41593:344-1069(+)
MEPQQAASEAGCHGRLVAGKAQGRAPGAVAERDNGPRLVHAHGLAEVAHGAGAARTQRVLQAQREAVNVRQQRVLRIFCHGGALLLGSAAAPRRVARVVVALRREAVRVGQLRRARPDVARRVAVRGVLGHTLVEVSVRVHPRMHRHLAVRIGAGWLRGVHAVRGRAQLAHGRRQMPGRRASAAVSAACAAALRHGTRGAMGSPAGVRRGGVGSVRRRHRGDGGAGVHLRRMAMCRRSASA